MCRIYSVCKELCFLWCCFRFERNSDCKINKRSDEIKLVEFELYGFIQVTDVLHAQQYIYFKNLNNIIF